MAGGRWPEGRHYGLPSSLPQPPQEPKRSTQQPPVHCWVVDCPELPGRRPGLLLGWERGPEGWRGQVVVAAQGMIGPLTLTLWVAAEQLRPA